MAEVLSPAVSYNDTISRLQARPVSSDMSIPQNHQPRALQMPRSQYSNQNTSPGFRGTSTAPVAPYAFKSTPALRSDNRPTSGSLTGQPLAAASSSSHNRQRYPAPESISTISSASSSDPSAGSQQPYSKDDALLFTHFQPPSFNEEPQAVKELHLNTTKGPHQFNDSPSKPSPERYHRGHRRAESSVGSIGSDSIVETAAITTAQMGQIYQHPQQVSLSSSTERSPTPASSELPKRYRRTSNHGNMEVGSKSSAASQVAPGNHTNTQNTVSCKPCLAACCREL